MKSHKLTHEAGAASAAAAAAQAKAKAQRKRHAELLCAALTPAQQRDQAQVELLCDFLSNTHLLHTLQPTALKSLAQAMGGHAFAPGSVIYRQGELARHLYVVLSGQVAMYERDQHQSQAGAAASREGSPHASASSPHHAGTSCASPQAHIRSSQSSSKHGRSGSPSSSHGLGSRAGGGAASVLGGASSSSAAGNQLLLADVGTGSSPAQLQAEVRRVGPREAFGEDDITAGCIREQTAVAGAATAATFKSSNTVTQSGSSGGTAALDTHSSSSSSTGAAEAATTTGGTTTGSSSCGGDLTPRMHAASSPSSTGGSSAVQQQSAAAVMTAAAAAAAASAGTDISHHIVVLQLSADDYGAALEGRLTSLLEEKVAFLTELPAMKGLSLDYLKSLSHCFHQVRFEPREVLVRQGDTADCIYVLKSGQVCVLIDPSMTLTEASASAAGDGSSAAPNADTPGEVDVKKLVQVCLLGSGAIIGDMSVHETAGGPPRRSATVVALTELLTYKVPLREFKRRMPEEVLEGMRQVAQQKLVMNEHKAQGRALANGKDGVVMLGGVALPESVLQGRGLRVLLEAQGTEAVPVEGLVQALELYFSSGTASPKHQGATGVATNSSSSSITASGSQAGACAKPGRPRSAAGSSTGGFMVGGKTAREVEGFVDSLSRHGFLTAPPQAFLALMTDWRSARTNNTAHAQQVPQGWQFPLPLPNKLHPAEGMLAPLAKAAPQAGAPGSWAGPHISVHTSSVYLQGHSPRHSPTAQVLPPPAAGQGEDTPGSPQGGAGGRLLITSPTPLLEALQLDGYVQQAWPQSPSAAATHCSHPATPTNGAVSAAAVTADGCTLGGASRLDAAAVARGAASQLVGGCMPAGGLDCHHGRSKGGGFRGMLHRATLSHSHQLGPARTDALPAYRGGSDAAVVLKAGAGAGTTSTSPTPAATTPAPAREPTLHEATIKAAALIRPGSSISISRCDSPRPHGLVTSVHVAAELVVPAKTKAVLSELGPTISAAVVANSAGKQELTFHGAEVASGAAPCMLKPR